MVDHNTVLLNGAFLERHKVEPEGGRLGNTIRQPEAGTIVGSQYPSLYFANGIVVITLWKVFA